MPKKTIRDITINKKPARTTGTRKTSASSVVKTKSKPKAKKPVASKKTSRTSESSGFTHSYREHHTPRSKGWLAAVIILLLVGLGGWTLFGSATVTITPESLRIPGVVDITAYQNATDGALEYEVIKIEETLSQDVTAGAAQEVSEKASGTIVIYNEEASAQRLREETRFETPDGLIFKLPKGDSITVPAAVGGTPGSLEAVVYADEPGDAYNIDLVDFVIPGWREINSPKFETQYARSQTSMTGGFSGVKRIVDTDDEDRTRLSLQTTLRDRLMQEAPAQIPPEFIFFDTLAEISFSSLPSTDSSDTDNVTLTEQAVLDGVLFNTATLSRIMAETLVQGYQGEPVTVTNFDELEISSVSNTDEEDSETVQFTISGTPYFVWDIATDVLMQQLPRVAKKDIHTALAEFTGVKNAQLTMYPFWLRTIPEKVRIDVVMGE